MHLCIVHEEQTEEQKTMAKHTTNTVEHAINEATGSVEMIDLTNVVEQPDSEVEVENKLPPAEVDELTLGAQTMDRSASSPTTTGIDIELYKQLGTTSAKIRAMHKDGHSTANIARALGIRYQHARNVIKDPLKRAQAPAPTVHSVAAE